jgi:hypothetical protein
MKLETVREKQIDAYLANNNVKEDQKLRLVLKGQPNHLEVFRIPIKYLMFNIRNGRFAAELLAKESELKRKLDSAIPEDGKTIRQLLLDLNPDETEGLRIDLKENGQLDPGVITRDGAVINANRRMAILSSLYDETQDPKFEYLRVARLPKDVDEKDLWRIEAGLQFAKEFRLDYSPVNELLKLKEGHDNGLSEKDISRTLLNRFTPAKVLEKLAILKLMESYLIFIDKPGQYHTVQEERDVEKFNSLQTHVVTSLKKKGMKESEIAKLLTIAFLLIQKTDLTHWDIRLLGKIAAEEKAYKELLKVYDPKHPSSTATDALEEGFATAEEILEAQESHNRPERLLKKALSALQGVDADHPKLADTAVKTVVAAIKEEVDRLTKGLKN